MVTLDRDGVRNNVVSVPLFGDSFFMVTLDMDVVSKNDVSVPSFGDSFFIT